MSDETVGSWVGLDAAGVTGGLQFQQVTPKAWDEDDVDVKIMYCGICASDYGVLKGEYAPLEPRVGGHEIVGEVVRVGPKVANLKVGDMVGVGWQCDACRECDLCKNKDDQYCAGITWTLGLKYGRGAAKGTMSHGGFAKMWRGASRYAVKLPASLDPGNAAPLLCAGVTVYSPMKTYGAGTTRKRVGVIGIGGLGHAAVLIAKAMGAQVTAISRGEAKKADALALGATTYISTGKDLKEDFKGHENSLDLIICTINPDVLPVADYLSLLAPKGLIVVVGIVLTPLAVPTIPLIIGGRGVVGSNIGSPEDIADLFALAAEKDIKLWVQRWNMDDINKAMVDFGDGKPNYRYVLVNTDNGGKM